MDFLVLSSGSAVAEETGDDSLNELHWSYMDRFADGMTARGPTLDHGREAWTGSMHVVDLPGPQAAREFVTDEPYHRAGLFEEHRIWRFTNLLGRTMWEFDGPADRPRFLVLALGAADAELPEDALILHGLLGDPDTGETVGVVLAAQAESREALDAWLAGMGGVEVHDWEFGGRR